MPQTKTQAKYIPVNIPVILMKRIQNLVTNQGGFMSATDYATYVLRVILSRHPEENDNDLFSSDDLNDIRSRLVALGSLSSAKNRTDLPKITHRKSANDLSEEKSSKTFGGRKKYVLLG